MYTMTTPLTDRFLSKIAEPFDAHNDCFKWTGAKRNCRGGIYGMIQDKGRKLAAHRVSYELFVGPIPEGFVIHHQCENTLCVNPSHLEAVPHGVNVRLGMTLLTHCRRGHAFDDANTFWWRGYRYCRQCRALSAQAFRHRKER
jgi:hypothetical protein